MKKQKWAVTGILFLATIILLSGCVAKTDFENLQSEKLVLEEDVLSIEADYSALGIDYAVLEELAVEQEKQITELSDECRELARDLQGAVEELNKTTNALSMATMEIERVMVDLDVVKQELADIEKVYPLTGFDSVMQLEDWIKEYPINTTTTYIDEGYRSALKIQDQGMKDGYLISVIYDEDERDPNVGMILNGVEIGGKFYVWEPETGTVYYWYTWLER